MPLTMSLPLNLKSWAEDNRRVLRPPTGEGRVLEDTSDFLVSVVGGPSRRKDYHVSPHEELFLQLEGDLVLRIRDDDGLVHEVAVGQGELFALPANVPHSPQRPEGSLGLVVERRRRGGEDDTVRFYCDRCNCSVFEEGFSLDEAAAELADILGRFWEDATMRTCTRCGTVVQPPRPGEAVRAAAGPRVISSSLKRTGRRGAQAVAPAPKPAAKRRVPIRRG